MMNQPAYDWTAARVERLKDLHAQGMCAIDIAEAIGANTKNVVLGKLHRLGLSRPREPARPKPPRVKRRASFVAPPQLRPPAPQLVLDPDEIPVDQRKTLIELENHHCRFPYDDPAGGVFFCGADGADVDGKIPYCPQHCRIAYRRGTDSFVVD